jgi:hypothetical protein
MTRSESNIRLILYVMWGGLSAAAAGINALEVSDPKAVVGFFLGIAMAVVANWRAYIDTSPAQIAPDPGSPDAKNSPGLPPYLSNPLETGYPRPPNPTNK